MALDYIIGGLQLLSAAVNVLALGAFWISPGLRATANRFVINLLVANIVACCALTPALWLHGGLKTSFHMDNGVASTVETIYQSSPSNIPFEAQNADQMVIGDITVNPLHHQHQPSPQQTYSYHRANRYERDVEQQPDSVVQSNQQLQDTGIEKAIESVVIERDERGNVRKITEKQVVDIQSADGDNDVVEIVEEFDAEPAAMVGSERTLNAESFATIKQKSSTAQHHRAYTVFSENALIFDCTRFWGFDFAATIGKRKYYLFSFTRFLFHAKIEERIKKTIAQTNKSSHMTYSSLFFCFTFVAKSVLFICLFSSIFIFHSKSPPYCQTPYRNSRVFATQNILTLSHSLLGFSER